VKGIRTTGELRGTSGRKRDEDVATLRIISAEDALLGIILVSTASRCHYTAGVNYSAGGEGCENESFTKKKTNFMRYE
jgi:hypothetical protein